MIGRFQLLNAYLMLIDIHAHIVDPDYLNRLAVTPGMSSHEEDGKHFYKMNGYTVAWSRPDMFDIDHRVQEMDRKGIDIRVLSLSTPNVYPWRGQEQVELCRNINDQLHTLCQLYPKRFLALASLPLDDMPSALRELARCIDELGMVGVALGSNIAGVALDDERLHPLWAQLSQYQLPIFIHPMFPTYAHQMSAYELPLRLGFPFETTTAAARLIYAGVLERYPDLSFILAHTGGALLTLMERLDNGYRLFPECRKYISQLPSVYGRRFFYDTASFSAPVIEMACQFAGAGQVLFGTDDPFINQDPQHVLTLSLSENDKQAILGGNAKRLLKL